MKKLLLLSLMAAVLVGCGAKDETSVTPSGSGKYDSEVFAFNYPEGWTLDEKDTEIGKIVIVYAPKEEGKTIQANLNVIVQDLSKMEAVPTLEKYTEDSKTSLGTIVKDLKIVSEGASNLAGNPAYEISYQGSTQNTPDQVFQWWQNWTIKGDKAYIITMTDSAEAFATNAEVAKMVSGSFEIK